MEVGTIFTSDPAIWFFFPQQASYQHFTWEGCRHRKLPGVQSGSWGRGVSLWCIVCPVVTKQETQALVFTFRILSRRWTLHTSSTSFFQESRWSHPRLKSWLWVSGFLLPFLCWVSWSPTYVQKEGRMGSSDLRKVSSLLQPLWTSSVHELHHMDWTLVFLFS